MSSPQNTFNELQGGASSAIDALGQHGVGVHSVVVIGAGECAARFVSSAREQGYRGSLVLLGDEGLAPYERPPLSKQTLLDTGTPQPTTALTLHRLAELDVVVDLSDPVMSLDRKARTVTTRRGTMHTYDELLIATGAKSRPLPFEGAKHALMLRTYDDALRLREALVPGVHVAVIGGGFIGLEVAASARTLGCEVTVIEMADRLMGRAVPVQTAALMEHRHRQEGVVFHLGVGVSMIELTTNERPYLVHLSNGICVAADLVVAGIGAVPETQLAEDSGLLIDNGIATDEHLRTSDPNIFAAGDCASFLHPLYNGRRVRLETWQNAHDHGVLAATNILGGSQSISNVPWFWSDQYDLTLQVAGLAYGSSEVVRKRSDGLEIRFSLDSDGHILSASGVATGSAVARDIRLAKILIEQRCVVSPQQLSDPTVSLKSLLAERSHHSH